jgi:segregation and condensation protein B
MSIKGKLEAIIYAAEEPVSLDQLAGVLKEAGLTQQLLAPNSAETEDGIPAESQQAAAKDPKTEKAEIKSKLRTLLDEMSADFASDDRGIELRQVAGGYRISTKPEHHDVVRSFAKGLKPPVRLSLPALETLAVIAYKQPVTAPEISEIRGVDSSGVLATLLDRKLITTAGRKAVIGRPILYKTTKDFLVRFGLKDVQELPSMEEFEKMTGDGQSDLFEHTPVADATGVPDAPTEIEDASLQEAEPEQTETSHAGQPEEA